MLLKSERIFLREFIESDWKNVHKYASQEKVCKYQAWGPNSVEETKAFVKKVLDDATQIPRTRFVFAIIKKEDNEMIGAGEFNIRDFNNKAGEIAYIINPTYWGKGFATEAAKMLVEFGFSEIFIGYMLHVTLEI